MEITQDQFTANLQQMPQEAQVQVVQIIENNEPPALQAFAASLGVTLSTSADQGLMDSPDALEEAGGMGRLSPRERNIREMQEFESPYRGSSESDPEPLADRGMTGLKPSTAPSRSPEEEPQGPMDSPDDLEEAGGMGRLMPRERRTREQMQQLAMGDQVAGMIDQPGAEDETGVADDVPMDVREGAFIINAAALAKVGRKDFEERIIEPAIEYLKEKDGIEIDKAAITKPSQQVNGDQKILASNKEYHIPPELAEVIGTDLLEKINNSGKEETEKKLEEQEQQPQQKQEVPVRAKNGGEIRPKKKPKAPPLNKEGEIDMLARLLIAESEGEGREGMQAVANVVQNRIKDSSPDTGFRDQKTFESVITAKNQFAGYNDDRYDEAPSKGAAWKMALDVAKKAVEGKLPDITQGSTYYRNKKTPIGTPGSTKDGQDFFDKNVATGNFEIYKDIGKHTFYKEKRSSTYVPRPRLPNSPPEGRTPLALEEAPPAQQKQTDNIRVSPESVNRSFMAESPDQDPRLRTQTQPPAN